MARSVVKERSSQLYTARNLEVAPRRSNDSCGKRRKITATDCCGCFNGAAGPRLDNAAFIIAVNRSFAALDYPNFFPFVEQSVRRSEFIGVATWKCVAARYSIHVKINWIGWGWGNVTTIHVVEFAMKS